MTATPIYHRLPGETAKAYEAFSIYRDMGIDRSNDAVGLRLGKSKVLMDRWSSQWNWVERVDTWDTEQDMMRQEEAIAANRKQYKQNLAEFQKNHLGIGKAAFKASGLAVQQIMEYIEKSKAVNSLDDANKLANIVRSLTPISELWAKALAVDRLLETMREDA